MTFTTRKDCRLCGGALDSVLDLGAIHISTFIDTNEIAPPKVPIELVKCFGCGLMQLRHTVNPDIMYANYWYKSGLNRFMVDALGDVVNKTLDRVTLLDGDIIVDIGANDGTLLAQYPEEIRKKTYSVAFEPSNISEDARPHCNVLVNDYFTAKKYPFGQRAKIITSIAMFYDLEDPHSFIDDAKHVLHKDGVWVIQMMDMLSMLKTSDFPNLCHEHLEYYTLSILNDLLKQHKLTIFDCEYNNVNGSSLRAYICHENKRPVGASVTTALAEEVAYFDSINNDPGSHFGKAIESIRDKVVAEVRKQRAAGRTVAVLGASTKGNTTLQYFNLGPDDIIHAAEVNPDKYGKYTVGSNIPIIPQTESLKFNPDFYLILPWSFLPNFLDRFSQYLSGGGAFIVPLPEPAIYTMEAGEVITWPL